MQRIEGRARSVRELLDSARYTLDFYQREYAWQERQVRELVDDLTGRFGDFHEEDHERAEVERYGHYFLGSIVISHKRGQRFIVDGQQRLTTLTLLLIHLLHLQDGREDAVDVRKLIYSEKYGRKSFNLDVSDRNEVMRRLLDGNREVAEDAPESSRNIVRQFEHLVEHFPEELRGAALPYFVDWLLENVHLVEIEAYSDEDAYTIFETMNDRGLSLSLPEMLKGYVLANIRQEEDQREVNASWKRHMQALKEVGDEEDVDFFKNWLRARYAETIRPGRKGSENKDFERIGTEFHRWVRDQKDRIGLTDSESFLRFVRRDLDFYARQALQVRRASLAPEEGWESLHFNEDRGFTFQHQAVLAALEPDEPAEITRRKVALVADFLDIWIARRVWNFHTIAYSSVRYTLFTLTRELRGRDLEGLSEFLRGQLEEQPERFATQPRFRLHQQNYRQVRHILARLTHWVDRRCGLVSHFEDLVSQGRARPFEIEHIWADDHARFQDIHPHLADFQEARNRLGGLLLIQRGLNQSLGAGSYESKREAYVTKGENLLARSLHPEAYTNNPGFRRLIESTGLPFRAHERFGPEDQAERQELYLRIAEWVWNPSRLDLAGETPPVHEPLAAVSAAGVAERAHPRPSSAAEGPPDPIDLEREGFWEQVLPLTPDSQGMRERVGSLRRHWIGFRQDGFRFNYVVLQDGARAELYLAEGSPEDVKRSFDALHARRASIEAAFGGALCWERLDDRLASRVSVTLEGGLRSPERWESIARELVEAMERLTAALGPELHALRG